MTAPLTVKISANIEPLEAALAEFDRLLMVAPECVCENFAGLGDVTEQLLRIGPNDGTAALAGEVIVRLEPTDFLLRLLAALRAGDWDRLSRKGILDVIRHESSSVGLLEPPQRSGLPGVAIAASGDADGDGGAA